MHIILNSPEQKFQSKNSFYTDKMIQIFEENNLLHVDKDSIPLLKGITIKMDISRYNDSIRNRTYIAELVKIKNHHSFQVKKKKIMLLQKLITLVIL